MKIRSTRRIQFIQRGRGFLQGCRSRLKTDIFFSDIVEITLKRLDSKRYRTILTILGVGIGIGVVYVLVSLTFGVQKLVIGNLVTSESLLSLDVTPNTEIKDIVKLTEAKLEEIKNTKGVV